MHHLFPSSHLNYQKLSFASNMFNIFMVVDDSFFPFDDSFKKSLKTHLLQKAFFKLIFLNCCIRDVF